MPTPHDDQIENRPPNLAARDRAYGQPTTVTIKDNRPKPTPAPGAVDLLATLVDQMRDLRGGVAAIRARVDEMAPRVVAAESAADMAHDEALAVRRAIDDVIPLVCYTAGGVSNLEDIVIEIANTVAPIDSEGGADVVPFTNPADSPDTTPEDPK